MKALIPFLCLFAGVASADQLLVCSLVRIAQPSIGVASSSMEVQVTFNDKTASSSLNGVTDTWVDENQIVFNFESPLRFVISRLTGFAAMTVKGKTMATGQCVPSQGRKF
jgi:hypothetical protein